MTTTEAPPRTWTLRDEGQRPLTTNAVAKMHRLQWAARTADTRRTWCWLARQARIPRLERAVIAVVPLHANGRSPQDVAACAPALKAAVDGLIDARVLADDGPAHLLAITFLQPHICGVDGLSLTIEEAL